MRTSLLCVPAALFAAGVCGCGSVSSSPAGKGGSCSGSTALVAVSDYASSGIGAVSLDGRGALSFGVDLGKDPALTVSHGRAFLVARDADLAFELDPRCGTAMARFALHDPARAGSGNPQDVAVAPSGALWVPRYNAPAAIAIVRTGAAIQTIDLSPYDADKNPNASSVRIVDVGGAAKAFVTLERLDDNDLLKSKQPSQMLRLDVASALPETTIELEGRNPFGLPFEDDGALWLSEPGNFDDAREPLAGIERFDTRSSTTKLVVHETDLGGSVAEVAVSGKCGVAIVAGSERDVNPTSVVTFDAISGKVLARGVVGPTAGYDLQGLEWVPAEGTARVLLVGDRRRTDRGFAVHALDRVGDCDLRARPDAIFLSQKPVAVRAAR